MRKIGLLIMLLCFVSMVNAQHTITGMVMDKNNNEPLPGATIELELKASGKEYKLLNGLDGSFVIKNLAAGTYSISVKYMGYRSHKSLLEIPGAQQIIISMEPDTDKNLEQVTVTGRRIKEFNTSTHDRVVAPLQNSLSARVIELSPDLSVANAVQRVSGVSLERSTNGDGQYAIVRGMDKRYNYSMVNGVKIPSPDNKNRYVPLDIFPADMIGRLEVIKAPTPAMEGDAIGGAINMVMKDAPAKKELTAKGAIGITNATTGKNSFTSFGHSASYKYSPRYNNGVAYNAVPADFPYNNFTYKNKTAPVSSYFNLSGGTRLLQDKLGIMLAGTYQNTFRNVNGVFFGSETDATTNSTALTDIYRRHYSIQQQRMGLHGKVDYKFNPRHQVSLYSGWMNLIKKEYREQADTNLVLGRTVAGSGRISLDYRSLYDNQQIFNTTLSGINNINNAFGLDWILSYSKASDNRPDLANLAITTGVLPDASGRLIATPLTMAPASRQWYYSKDRDKSAYLNMHYTQKWNAASATFSAGGMYRNKERDSYFDSYQLNPLHSNDTYTGDIRKDSFTVFNPAGSETNALNYAATENVGAAYAMAAIQINKVEIIGGARYENTQLKWRSAITDQAAGKTGNIRYNDVLPSVQIKYDINKHHALRGGYYSAISRPNFYEIVPHTGGDPDADYKEIGNPYLKRTTADNFDIRYGYYGKRLDQVLIGVFYKKIKNPIEYALETVGATAVYYRPDNFGTANNKGIELDALHYWRWFGLRANYTFTDSKITTSKHLRHLDANGRPTEDVVMQTRPLQGQSKHIANLSLLVREEQRLHLNAQLSFSYTGRRINTVSEYVGNDLWQKGFMQMDFSFEKRLHSHWFVFGKINNILNTPYELEIQQKLTANPSQAPYQSVGSNVFIRKDVYGASGLAGISFKL